MNYNLVGSGEDWVLDFIAKELNKDNPVYFDVGANVGLYCAAILKDFPLEGRVFCFEPSAETFNLLKQNIHDKRVHLVNEGLGDVETEMKLYLERTGSSLASVYIRENLEVNHEEIVKIQTLDNFAFKNQISEIDFVKIDVEGFDINVIKGAGNLIKAGKIRFIQFEFGGTQIPGRVFLKDFWNLLNNEYSIYRILKDGLLPLKEYSEQLENFNYANYLAIRK